MKDEYPRYGKRAHELEKNLTQGDQRLHKEFLQFCAISAGPGQLSKHRRNLFYFRDIVEKPYDAVTKQDAIVFWGLLNNAPYEENTKIAVRKSGKRFLKWHFRDLNMVEPLKIPKYLVNNKRGNKAALFKPHELKLMLHRAERLRDKAILILLYETAARPQEIRDFRWGDVNWDEQEVHLYSKKTKDDRDLPLHESLQHLKRWYEEWVYPDPQESDFIFPSIVGLRHARTKAISVSYINRMLQSLARKAGIQRGIFTYLLRHTLLTEIRKLGLQGPEFNQFAGHQPGSNMENVYIHIDNEDMKNSVREKVYKIQELKKSERDQYEDRITRLERKLGEVGQFSKESREIMNDLKEVVDFLIESRETMISTLEQL